jgi:hypothetical protein
MGYKTKICQICGKEYRPTSSNQKRCIGCRLDGDREWRRKYNHEWRREHPEIVRRGTKDYRLRVGMKKKYGFTPEQYDSMLESQGGKCIVCGSDNLRHGVIIGLAIDHDHVTGKIRGLLCSNCNTALGMLGNSPERILALYQYLCSNIT